MARNGSGSYSLPATVAPPNTAASSSTVNSVMNDIAAALTDSINKDGTKAFAANQSMGGFKMTSVGAGTAAGDAPNVAQVQSSVLCAASAVGGTVDAITITMSPATSAWVNKERFSWVSGGANTVTTPTLNKDGLGAKTIKKGAGLALAAGDTGASGHVCLGYYNGTDVILLNPAVTAVSGSLTTSGYTQSTAKLLGRTTAGTGAIEEIGVAGNLYLSGGVLTGTVPSGSVVSVTRTEYTTYTSTTAVIPWDDTVPTSSEGIQLFTHAHTPASATNNLLVSVLVHVSGDEGSYPCVVTLLKDSDASVLAVGGGAVTWYPQATAAAKIEYYAAAGTTSAITFKVRGGTGFSGATAYFNGGSGRKYGGKLISSITVTEIKG